MLKQNLIKVDKKRLKFKTFKNVDNFLIIKVDRVDKFNYLN